MAYRSLRDFIAKLEAEGELVRVREPVATALEITEICTRLLASGGPAVLFERPVMADGSVSPIPCLANLFGTVKRVAMGVTLQGKARYIGASSMYAWQFSKALYTSRLRGWTEFVSMQNHVNLLNREEEREMLPLCADQGIAVMPWSPLARGRLARAWNETSSRQETDEFGKKLYTQFPDSDRLIVDQVSAIASARGVPRAQVAMAWLVQKKGVTSPIVGASKPDHLKDAVAALSLKLTAEEIAALEKPYVPHNISGF
jgi:aryl-alcohol dehydrogenase-like predicted oxidoreductase